MRRSSIHPALLCKWAYGRYLSQAPLSPSLQVFRFARRLSSGASLVVQIAIQHLFSFALSPPSQQPRPLPVLHFLFFFFSSTLQQHRHQNTNKKPSFLFLSSSFLHTFSVVVHPSSHPLRKIVFFFQPLRSNWTLNCHKSIRTSYSHCH